MKSVQKGFTLIELMIVIAIIGILAAIAIPAYQNYTIRAQVTEGDSLIGGLETAFDENYANTGTAATSNAAVGVSKVISGTYVSSVNLGAGGNITVKYGGSSSNSAIVGKTVVWSPYKSANGDITWLCNDGTATTKSLASGNLSAIGTGAANGTISTASGNAQYLPTICQ